MISYTRSPETVKQAAGKSVASFMALEESNRDAKTVASFGEEWEKFNTFSEEEIKVAGDQYFDVLAGENLSHLQALDLGCGSGRWTRYLSPLVQSIESVDPSAAVLSAAATHADLENVRWTQCGVDELPFADGSFDLIVCLGVLHHIPDTGGALKKATTKLKPGGRLLLYLYYALDNRGIAYRTLFHLSTAVRRVVSALPGGLKRGVCDAIAALVYWPLVTLARLVRVFTQAYKKLPLAYYCDKTFRIMRNDALDRFGTPLEQRFSRHEIATMLEAAGMEAIRFSEGEPYWHCVSTRKSEPE
ncbi:MAG: class I SAM-dependent methyltransferase [Salibacteraceae bacterium]